MGREHDTLVDAQTPWPRDEPTAATGDGDDTPDERWVRITPARLVAACAVALVLLTIAVGGSILAFVNNDRAEGWRDRSASLQELVADRTRQLNDRTTRLNTVADTLKKSQSALTRSEKDVVALQTRQTELANEKAQLADQRALMEHAAELLQTCNTGLGQVLSAISQGEDPSSTLDLDGIELACRNASSAMPEP